MHEILLLKSNAHNVGLQDVSNFFSIDQSNWNLISQPDAQLILKDINSSISNLKRPSGNILIRLGIGLIVIGFFGFAIAAFTFKGISPYYFWILFAIGMFVNVLGAISRARAYRNFVRDIELLINSEQPAYASRGLFIQFQRVLGGTATSYCISGGLSTYPLYTYYIKISQMNTTPSLYSQFPSDPLAGSVAIPMAI